MERIKIGTIVNAVGLKGEVKIYNYSDYKERFEELPSILVAEKKSYRPFDIQSVRYQKNMVILKLTGIDDRNAAEALKERDVFITEEDLRELPEDTFYVRDLIGCQVLHAENGTKLGEIADVIQNAAQDIYQIKLENGKDAMIPAVAQFVKEVSVAERTVKIQPIPGLIDDAGIQVTAKDEE